MQAKPSQLIRQISHKHKKPKKQQNQQNKPSQAKPSPCRWMVPGAASAPDLVTPVAATSQGLLEIPMDSCEFLGVPTKS